MDEKIRIRYETVKTLRNMNTSVVANVKEYDYRFLVYLFGEVFDKTELFIGSEYKNQVRNRKYQELDRTKIEFVAGNYYTRKDACLQNHFDDLFYFRSFQRAGLRR